MRIVLPSLVALALTGCATTADTSTTSPQFAARCMAAAKLIQPIVQTNDIPEAAPMELYEAVEKHWLDLVSSRASDTGAALNYSGQAIEALSKELEDGGQPAFEQARSILQNCEASTQGEGA